MKKHLYGLVCEKKAAPREGTRPFTVRICGMSNDNEKRGTAGIMFHYKWHTLHLALFWRPWQGKHDAGLILPSILCCVR
jgi:hypothetical protein